MHGGYVCISIIHRTLTWTTGSLTCTWSFVCMRILYTGVRHTDSESAQTFTVLDSEKLSFLMLLTGFEPLDLQSNTLTTEPSSHPTVSINAYDCQTIERHWTMVCPRLKDFFLKLPRSSVDNKMSTGQLHNTWGVF